MRRDHYSFTILAASAQKSQIPHIYGENVNGIIGLPRVQESIDVEGRRLDTGTSIIYIINPSDFALSIRSAC